MAFEFTLELQDRVTPEDKGGPRVGIGARASVKRDTAGSWAVLIERGDGGNPEAYTYTVRTKLIGPFAAGETAELSIGTMDLPAFLPDFTPRNYRLRLVTLDPQPTIAVVVSAFIAPEPFAPAGRHPPLP